MDQSRNSKQAPLILKESHVSNQQQVPCLNLHWIWVNLICEQMELLKWVPSRMILAINPLHFSIQMPERTNRISILPRFQIKFQKSLKCSSKCPCKIKTIRNSINSYRRNISNMVQLLNKEIAKVTWTNWTWIINSKLINKLNKRKISI